MARVVHPIEKQSYEILRARVDTSGLPPWTRAVVERVIHASADITYLPDIVCEEADLAAAAAALRHGAPVVADSAMTAAGITAREAVCRVADPQAAALTRVLGITHAAAGIRVAGREVGPGAVWVIGTAPTALADLLARGPAPALVIGLPVGFVGAVEAKEALRDSGLPAVTNISEKGGAAVAAAALNALIYGDPLEELGEEEPPQAPGRTPHSASRRASGTTQPQAPLRGPGEEDPPPAPQSGAPPARPSAVLPGVSPARRPAREANK
jgi:precorrin-8X/cobalt-precorrin-8 methylmutase